MNAICTNIIYINNIEITTDLIDKCLDFCESRRQKFTINSVKTKEFPKNLMLGTETQQIINDKISKGHTTREVAKMLNCTQATITKHQLYYRNGLKFYFEWLAIWKFLEPLRNNTIEDMFFGILSDDNLKHLKRKNVNTIEDVLTIFSHNQLYDVRKLTYNFFVEKQREAIFNKIREEAYKLLERY